MLTRMWQDWKIGTLKNCCKNVKWCTAVVENTLVITQTTTTTRTKNEYMIAIVLLSMYSKEMQTSVEIKLAYECL